MGASQYQVNWENYWSALFADQDVAFWDVPASGEVGKVLDVFKESFDPTLPVIDFGCGNGTQSAELAQHFSSVVGLDVSAVAIGSAQNTYTRENLSFQVLDAMEPSQAEALHQSIGDANLYMRGVLHQIQAGDRDPVVQSIKMLLGQTGQLFLIELCPINKERFAMLSEIFNGPPPQLARVFQQGIKPAEISIEDIQGHFPKPQFSILAQGDTTITTNTQMPDESELVMPAFYLLIQAS